MHGLSLEEQCSCLHVSRGSLHLLHFPQGLIAFLGPGKAVFHVQDFTEAASIGMILGCKSRQALAEATYKSTS
jgi:hypothetical protein